MHTNLRQIQDLLNEAMREVKQHAAEKLDRQEILFTMIFAEKPLTISDIAGRSGVLSEEIEKDVAWLRQNGMIDLHSAQVGNQPPTYSAAVNFEQAIAKLYALRFDGLFSILDKNAIVADSMINGATNEYSQEDYLYYKMIKQRVSGLKRLKKNAKKFLGQWQDSL